MIDRAKSLLLQGLRLFRSRWRPPLTQAASHLHFGEGVRLGSGRLAAHVIARSLCRYRYIPWIDLPRRDRLGYVQLQLLGWAPFVDADYALVQGEQGAMVFAWDKAALRQRCEAASLGEPERLFPESVLSPALRDGLGLWHCTEGFEAQLWQAGELVASRWWPGLPDAEAWLNFQRSCGLDAEAQLALPTEPAQGPWPETPWGEARQLGELLNQGVVYVHAGLAAAALLLTVPTLVLLQGWMSASAHLAELRAEKQQLQTAAGPVLQSRTDALQALESLDLLLQQVDHASPVTLLAHLSRQLPRDGTLLRELEWQDKRVQLTLLPPAGASRTVYVKALQDGGWLGDIHEIASTGVKDGVVLVGDLAASHPLSSRAGTPVDGAVASAPEASGT